MYKCKYISKIGVLTLVGDTEGLYELLFEQSRYGSKYPDAIEDDSLVIFNKVCMWLDAYFSGERYSVDFPIVLEGTSFQVEVWKLLLEIPYGKCVTYKDIAEACRTQYKALVEVIFVEDTLCRYMTIPITANRVGIFESVYDIFNDEDALSEIGIKWQEETEESSKGYALPFY